MNNSNNATRYGDRRSEPTKIDVSGGMTSASSRIAGGQSRILSVPALPDRPAVLVFLPAKVAPPVFA
jgi:hypothetical protein